MWRVQKNDGVGFSIFADEGATVGDPELQRVSRLAEELSAEAQRMSSMVEEATKVVGDEALVATSPLCVVSSVQSKQTMPMTSREVFPLTIQYIQPS